MAQIDVEKLRKKFADAKMPNSIKLIDFLHDQEKVGTVHRAIHLAIGSGTNYHAFDEILSAINQRFGVRLWPNYIGRDNSIPIRTLEWMEMFSQVIWLVSPNSLQYFDELIGEVVQALTDPNNKVTFSRAPESKVLVVDVRDFVHNL